MPHNPTLKGSIRIPRRLAKEAAAWGDPDAIYALVTAGNCMDPECCDGDMVLVSKTEPPSRGDLVVIYSAKPGQSWLKRLTTGVYPGTLGVEPHPESTVQSLVCMETLNPRRTYSLPAHAVAAVHKVLAVVRKHEISRVPPKPATRRRAAA